VQTTRAAIAPGTHPHKVNSATINIVPHPLSNTANGGKRMQSKALPNPMLSSPPQFPTECRGTSSLNSRHKNMPATLLATSIAYGRNFPFFLLTGTISYCARPTNPKSGHFQFRNSLEHCYSKTNIACRFTTFFAEPTIIGVKPSSATMTFPRNEFVHSYNALTSTAARFSAVGLAQYENISLNHERNVGMAARHTFKR
jgi:hypothetical protein